MFKVYSEPCKNCLLSKDVIVGPERVKQIIAEIKRDQSYFICHKSEGICCKTFYDKLGHLSQMIRIAERLNMVQVVEHADNKKLIPYRKMTNYD